VTAPLRIGTLARSRSAHGRRPGTRTSAVGKHHERMVKSRSSTHRPYPKTGPAAVIPCDVVPVVREHANRHEGSEFASPSPQRWLGPGDVAEHRIGPIPADSEKLRFSTLVYTCPNMVNFQKSNAGTADRPAQDEQYQTLNQQLEEDTRDKGHKFVAGWNTSLREDRHTKARTLGIMKFHLSKENEISESRSASELSCQNLQDLYRVATA